MITMRVWATAMAAFPPPFLPNRRWQPAELGADVGAGPACRPGALGEDVADLGVALAGAPGLVSPGGFVVARAQPGPGRQVRRGGEPGHVHPDLGDDHLGGPFTDSRDRPQQRAAAGRKGR